MYQEKKDHEWVTSRYSPFSVAAVVKDVLTVNRMRQTGETVRFQNCQN